jgi:hypothetical protein
MSKPSAHHHYVPQGYLKGFVNNGELYVINKKYGSIPATTPAGVVYVPGFYTVDTITEKDSSEAEDNFSKIETTCIPIIKKMITGGYLTNPNLADMAIYIALQYGRTPFSRTRMDDVTTVVATNLIKEKLVEAYNDPMKYKEMLEGVKEENPELDFPTREKIEEWILKPGPIAKMKVDNGTYVVQVFESAYSIADALLRKRWIVLRAPRDASFVTSDNPIGLYLNRSLKFGEMLAILLPDVKCFFPLDSKTCLVIVDNDHFELKESIISKDRVKSINRLIYTQAQQYVISSSKPLLRSLKAWHDRKMDDNL